MTRKPLRILHLEDDPADAERVERQLARAGLTSTVQRVTTKQEFLRALDEFEPDVVLCDHALAHFGATQALEQLRAIRPTTPLIVVTGALTEQLVIDYVRAGAADYISKANLQRLYPGIQAAVAARRRLEPLTPRQREVLRLLAEGRSTNEIADLLHLSVKTVETHRTALMHRLGIRRFADLIRFAIQVGLLPPGG
jgi:DNA-binding NarL/FixJ family response regulator